MLPNLLAKNRGVQAAPVPGPEQNHFQGTGCPFGAKKKQIPDGKLEKKRSEVSLLKLLDVCMHGFMFYPCMKPLSAMAFHGPSASACLRSREPVPAIPGPSPSPVQAGHGVAYGYLPWASGTLCPVGASFCLSLMAGGLGQGENGAASSPSGGTGPAIALHLSSRSHVSFRPFFTPQKPHGNPPGLPPLASVRHKGVVGHRPGPGRG